MISIEQLSEIQKKCVSIYNVLVKMYKQIDPLPIEDPSLSTLVSKVYSFNGNPDQYFVTSVFELIVPEYEAALWCTKNYEKISAVVERIKQERLLMIMQSDGVRRANDDLSQSLIRTLAEFRKQHPWRIQNNLIEVDQAPKE